MKNSKPPLKMLLVALLASVPFSCQEDSNSILDQNVVAVQPRKAQAIPLYRDCPQTVNSTDINLAVIDDYTEHTFSVESDDIGFFADCRVTRTFSKPIKSLKLTIVGGHADDIGYVGNCRVTPNKTGCFLGGSVTSPVNVTSDVTINGNSASFTLRAKETCCVCVTGWGEDNLEGSANARFHWEVKF